MNIHELVDELYEAFAEGLGEPLSSAARDLPCALRLAPEPVPWSRVFSHEVTLGAPALIAEGMAGVPSPVIREAVLAHMLAVIDAFGTDRIEDDQIRAGPGVFAVLGQARRERDRAMGRLFGRRAPPDINFHIADAVSINAIRRERSMLQVGSAVDLDVYERASLDKQWAGLVASAALARVAGWDARRCGAVRKVLESVWLGLQISDDVVDWEDDLARGGAWTVCLMKGIEGPAPSGPRLSHEAPVRGRVLQSGVLKVMLARALIHFRTARRLAAALGAQRLAAWAGSLERRTSSLVVAESRSPGYAVRAHALAAWAGEVLA